ncbi:MAG: hypothetical protein LQ350_007465 [Teloschistes chrysophthalmus]|nr:MAG: hypothetical protein LQ350_007465 [Niorma chrysophthalma]
MQASSHLDVHQEGSHFGPVEASQSNIFQGNFSGLTISQVAPSTYKGHYSNLSLQPVANYVQRPALHKQLRRQLHRVQTARAEVPQICMVWGLGGAGKSQLVLNYIQKYRHDYSAVIWVECGSKESIERDYIQIYRLLYGRPLGTGREILKVEDTVPAVKHWFDGREGQWLVVMDSADSIDDDQDRSYIDLRYFMPDAPGVHIIITSRSSTVQDMTLLEAIEVADMEPSEATELFRRCRRIQGLGPELETEIGQIVKELGYLALAITLAGLYVSVTPRLSSNIRRYLPEYRRRRKELLSRRSKQQVHRYGESVLSTWESSFDAVATQSPAAARLLGVLASMSFNDIFLRIFDPSVDGVSRQPDAALPPAPTWRSFFFPEGEWKYQLESALEVLQRYAFIQWRVDQQSYSMHKLVHAWGQDRLDTNTQWGHSDVALELLADATADYQLSPSYKLRLVPHLMANLGVYLERQREALGKKDPDTLRSMNNLAEVLRSQGNYDAAEQIHRQTLALKETVLGKEHPSTLTSMNNLAEVLCSQGNYDEAEQIHRQTLALRETVRSATRFSSIP